MGSIENVNILNNTFTMPNSTDPSTMCFTFGSNSSKQAKNIRFEGNTIDVKATMSWPTFGMWYLTYCKTVKYSMRRIIGLIM